MTPEVAFIEAAADLAHAAPRQFEAFVAQLRAYADRQRDACVQAPVAAVITMQGRAQAAGELVKDIADAPMKADRMKRNR